MIGYDRQLFRQFALGMVPVAILLLALFGFLLLAEALEDVGQGRFQTRDAVFVTLLHLPRVLLDLLPVIVLLGGLLGLGQLAAGSELIALRAAGQSPLRQSAPLLWLWLLLLLLAGGLMANFIPRAEVSANRLAAKALGNTIVDLESSDESALASLSASDSDDGAFWTRDPRGVLRVNRIGDGQTPEDLEIYHRDDSGSVVEILTASRARLLPDGDWQLEAVTVHNLSAGAMATRQLDSLRWTPFLAPSELKRLVMPATALSPVALWRAITDLEARGLATHRFRVQFWQQALLPLSLLAMALLALAMVQGSLRRVPLGSRVALGVLIGTGNYFLEQSSSQLALLLGGNALAVTLLPKLVLLLLAIAALTRRTP